MNVINKRDPSNPYKLDLIKVDKYTIAELSKKNANFIKAIVSIDSNYQRDDNKTNEKGTAYWFNEMLNKSSTYSYEYCLEKCIEIIDNHNSTHLEATKHGRNNMKKIIYGRCSSVEHLKQEVLVKPVESNTNNLFFDLLETMDHKTGYKVNNISFASKFISYARKYLNNNDTSFSKYDKVVAENLSKYQKYYADDGKSVSKSKFLNKSSDRKKLKTNKEKQKYTYETYIKYMKTIDDIQNHLVDEKGEKIVLTKEEIDHIIWYTSKGNYLDELFKNY